MATARPGRRPVSLLAINCRRYEHIIGHTLAFGSKNFYSGRPETVFSIFPMRVTSSSEWPRENKKREEEEEEEGEGEGERDRATTRYSKVRRVFFISSTRRDARDVDEMKRGEPVSGKTRGFFFAFIASRRKRITEARFTRHSAAA